MYRQHQLGRSLVQIRLTVVDQMHRNGIRDVETNNVAGTAFHVILRLPIIMLESLQVSFNWL